MGLDGDLQKAMIFPEWLQSLLDRPTPDIKWGIVRKKVDGQIYKIEVALMTKVGEENKRS